MSCLGRRKGITMTGRIAAALSMMAVLAMPMAAAHAAGDAGAGRDIVQRWCTGCHTAESGGADVAPPFASIANMPGRSDDYFWVWLSDPHPPMPNLYLSRQEIADVIAYLRTLRAE